MSLRGPFADISDRTGRFQLYFAKKELGDAFALLKALDRGDFLGAKGFVFRTKMGDLALHVLEIMSALLASASDGVRVPLTTSVERPSLVPLTTPAQWGKPRP